jgi:hypothetical protein
MQQLKKLSLFLLLLMATLGLQAQNGNVVVSDVKVVDMENGTGMIVVHLSGNQAADYPGGSFTISGGCIPGGSANAGIGTNTRVFVAPPVPGNGNTNGNQTVYLAGMFPLSPEGNSQDDDVTIDLTFYPRLGNGLDYTYSRVGRIKRNFKY